LRRSGNPRPTRRRRRRRKRRRRKRGRMRGGVATARGSVGASGERMHQGGEEARVALTR
jgi:hypothetical protein